MSELSLRWQRNQRTQSPKTPAQVRRALRQRGEAAWTLVAGELVRVDWQGQRNEAGRLLAVRVVVEDTNLGEATFPEHGTQAELDEAIRAAHRAALELKALFEPILAADRARVAAGLYDDMYHRDGSPKTFPARPAQAEETT